MADRPVSRPGVDRRLDWPALVPLVARLLLLRAAVQRIGAASASAPGREISTVDLRAMVRGVRSIFLAAAALSVAAGWIVGHPLPIVVGLVIAGVDMVETSLLLLVARGRREH